MRPLKLLPPRSGGRRTRRVQFSFYHICRRYKCAHAVNDRTLNFRVAGCEDESLVDDGATADVTAKETQRRHVQEVSLSERALLQQRPRNSSEVLHLR
ncbi:hypothetical protein EVAR_49738_1 [Eumeta japonica]|uniref:Uncharacterized protein n=1 Tax=Eumeta variegata TaxID=151549 RepID=A0A4C1ZSR4_EUMVA|nr:hypothetical protein EVAR_49738_1 [Eumeta japonica]